MFKLTTSFLLVLGLSQTVARVRKVSEEAFYTYVPQTSVTDHAAIDLDQQKIEEQLSAGTDQGRAVALRLYQNGAFSKSFAALILASPLANEAKSGVEVQGRSVAGNEIRGKVLDEADAGETIIRVQYATTSVQASYSGCQVGANPNPTTSGCFAAGGEITIGAFAPVNYSYTVETGNLNGRTIKGFSQGAKSKMFDCQKCPYVTYKKFYDYYGAFDYADQWVMAGFNKGKVDFTNGDADFSSYPSEALTEVIRKGTAYMNVWMYVIRELEDAVDDCENKCTIEGCNADNVNAWDEAVAFYSGSLVKSDPNGGVLLYSLAQKRCLNFNTCNSDGVAAINAEIFKQFDAGKQNIQQGNCSGAEATVKKITSLMTVPLVQGTIRYAHIIGVQNGYTQKAEAEGASFAAAVLPLLHSCSPSDANTVYQNMKTGSGQNRDFAAVKKAFENNYNCLGISCSQVGGLVQADGKSYFKGAEPCGTSQSGQSGAFEISVGFALGAIVTAVVALI